MWKALIKLVEKWSYRCDHSYVLIEKTDVLDREMYEKGEKVHCRTEYLYACEKCMDSKKLS